LVFFFGYFFIIIIIFTHYYGTIAHTCIMNHKDSRTKRNFKIIKPKMSVKCSSKRAPFAAFSYCICIKPFGIANILKWEAVRIYSLSKWDVRGSLKKYVENIALQII
jgi:hypothetical protein